MKNSECYAHQKNFKTEYTLLFRYLNNNLNGYESNINIINIKISDYVLINNLSFI